MAGAPTRFLLLQILSSSAPALILYPFGRHPLSSAPGGALALFLVFPLCEISHVSHKLITH